MSTEFEMNLKNEYLSIHSGRFQFLLKLIKKYAVKQNAKILDIGRSPFTKMILDYYSNVTTLGFEMDKTLLDKADPVDEKEVPHVVYNLNACLDEQSWVNCGENDLIIFAEVLEHLSVHSQSVFKFLNKCLIKGGILICQTPNAVSFPKRMRMILGINPFQKFEIENEIGAHHFREYTKSELIQFGKETGFEMVEHVYRNYFYNRNKIYRFLNSCFGIIPAFRYGQTIVYKKIADIN